MIPTNNRRVTDVYKKTQVETVDQKTLIVMCYNEAIRSLQTGMNLYRKKDFEGKSDEFNRAHGLISELLSSLNMEDGGVIAQNLNMIYNFMLKHITEGDIKGDMKALEEVVEMLSQLKSAWEEIGSRDKLIQTSVLEELQRNQAASLCIGI